MKAGKLIALGFSGILAAAGVTVATFEGKELIGYVDLLALQPLATAILKQLLLINST